MTKLKHMIKSLKINLLTFPSPSNISVWWNFGSILGMCLMIQIMTGLMLSMNYCPNINTAFNSIIYITNNTNYGWIMRNIHVNGASMYFLFMYIHISRGIYNFSFIMTHTWLSGMAILILSMMTAFMGYILPWGQMSFWGATVITNLLSVIPIIGMPCVEWVWGGFCVNNATLNRFFSFHFFIPLIIILLVGIHLFTLHWTGSSNPLGVKSNLYMIPFHPYFTIKDLLGFMILFTILMLISTLYPDMLMDPDNFQEANPMITPVHIKPEWYFLHAYAILRSVPNKLGGVICLLMSILILAIFIIMPKPKMKSMYFYPYTSNLFWNWMSYVVTLFWLGAQPLEFPYLKLAELYSIIYFIMTPTMLAPSYLWDLYQFSDYPLDPFTNNK